MEASSETSLVSVRRVQVLYIYLLISLPFPNPEIVMIADIRDKAVSLTEADLRDRPEMQHSLGYCRKTGTRDTRND